MVNDIFSLAPCADPGQLQGRCPGFIFLGREIARLCGILVMT